MKAILFILLLLIPFKGASANDKRCDTELNELKTFAAREADRLSAMLARTKKEIATLPKIERVRAKVLWVEADSSRQDLDTYLRSNEPIPCAQRSEDIRARLFKAQEFGFQVLFTYDDRARLTAGH